MDVCPHCARKPAFAVHKPVSASDASRVRQGLETDKTISVVAHARPCPVPMSSDTNFVRTEEPRQIRLVLSVCYPSLRWRVGRRGSPERELELRATVSMFLAQKRFEPASRPRPQQRYTSNATVWSSPTPWALNADTMDPKMKYGELDQGPTSVKSVSVNWRTFAVPGRVRGDSNARRSCQCCCRWSRLWMWRWSRWSPCRPSRSPARSERPARCWVWCCPSMCWADCRHLTA